MMLMWATCVVAWQALFVLMTSAEAEARPVRVFVMYGQGGVLTSPGMLLLAEQIRRLGKGVTVTTHNWDDYNNITADIRKLPADMPLIVVGFSLGAGSVPRVALGVPKRTIALGVAYDPSVWDRIPAAGRNIQKLLVYRNAAPDLWGRARIAGPQVQTTDVYSLHLAIQFDPSLHAKTLAAIKQVL